MEKKEELRKLLESSIQKNVPSKKFGILFSGGIDSVLLAFLCKKLNLNFTCFFGYVKGSTEAKDLAVAKKAAKELQVNLELASITLEESEELIANLIPLIGSASPVQVGVAIPIAIACKKAKEKGISTVFSGMGADELFCGYSKFRDSKDLAFDSLKLVQALPEKDLKRDLAIASSNGLELKTPFLDAAILKFALSLPKSQKLSANRNKIILRELALSLSLPQELAERKKLAAQYGSNSDKTIEKLAKKAKKSKTKYLEAFLEKKKIKAFFGKKKIAALFSGGKDSCLALWKMQQQGFEVKCLISIIPKNPDSFMYHKPNLKILKLQSKALGIPLLIEKTKGEKEKELAELKKALVKAKKQFGLSGVVSGALYSNYQRERIQKICKNLSLELYSPLWHLGQLDELLELLNNGFVFVLEKIAALGLSEEWLGKPITTADIAVLDALDKKFGFNVAGEGGEYESLVLDAPNFSKRICILKAEKKMENEFTGSLLIKEFAAEAKAI